MRGPSGQFAGSRTTFGVSVSGPLHSRSGVLHPRHVPCRSYSPVFLLMDKYVAFKFSIIMSGAEIENLVLIFQVLFYFCKTAELKGKNSEWFKF